MSTLTTRLIASGTPDDFTTEVQGAIAARFAAQASVDITSVTVVVVAASVEITISINVPEQQAATALNAVQGQLADPVAASTFLSGVGGLDIQVQSIQAAPAVTATELRPAASTPPQPPAPIDLTATSASAQTAGGLQYTASSLILVGTGAGGALLVVLVLLLCMARCKKGRARGRARLPSGRRSTRSAPRLHEVAMPELDARLPVSPRGGRPEVDVVGVSAHAPKMHELGLFGGDDLVVKEDVESRLAETRI